jgi:glycoside/pentoside/hexuronide:cation symporter, GPH family
MPNEMQYNRVIVFPKTIHNGDLMNQPLSLGTKIRYGVADLGIALLGSAVQFFILFYYTDVALINPTTAGTALLAGKLTWDAVNDPIFGYLSDRTRSRLGRRRIYMFAGALPLGLAAWLMFSLPIGLSGPVAFFAVLGTFLLFDTFHTMASVPYYAMTAELTYDYNDRASLTAIRMIFSVLGYILGAASTTLISGLFSSALGWDTRSSWSATGAIYGVIVVAAILFTAFTVKERSSDEIKPSTLPPLKAVLTTFRNRPFVLMLGAFIISSFSFTMLTALVPYFLIYQLEMKDSVPVVMLTMLLAIGIFLIPIKKLSDRINKGPAYAGGLLLASCAIVCAFFLPKGPTPWIYVIAVVAGIGFSGQWVFPWSMVPDVVEYDQKMTGERREGIYYGIWALVQKFTNALGIAVAGWSLGWFGYMPNVVQTDHALLGIRLFFSLVPAAALLLSLPFLIWYPITRESHAQLVAELNQVQEK